MNVNQEICPFCQHQIMGIEEPRLLTGDEDDNILGIRCCAVCAWMAAYCAIEEDVVEDLRKKQKEKANVSTD